MRLKWRRLRTNKTGSLARPRWTNTTGGPSNRELQFEAALRLIQVFPHACRHHWSPLNSDRIVQGEAYRASKDLTDVLRFVNRTLSKLCPLLDTLPATPCKLMERPGIWRVWLIPVRHCEKFLELVCTVLTPGMPARYNFVTALWAALRCALSPAIAQASFLCRDGSCEPSGVVGHSVSGSRAWSDQVRARHSR